MNLGGLRGVVFGRSMEGAAGVANGQDLLLWLLVDWVGLARGCRWGVGIVGGAGLVEVVAYTIAKLVRWFVYSDAIVVDTPIVDDRSRGVITNVEFVDLRIGRALQFCAYLDEQHSKLAADGVAFDWKAAHQDLVRNIDVAERAVRAAIAKGRVRRSLQRRW